MSLSSSPVCVIHVPHASREIPAQYRDQFKLNDRELEMEIIRMTDSFTDELFAMPSGRATVIRHGVSRLLVDPERFENDCDEPMAKIGMGAIYQTTSLLTSLRKQLSESVRNELLDHYYRPHHAELTRAVYAALEQHDRCVIIDAHSFPSRPWPYELEQRPDRPEICIGTDNYHTPEVLQEAVVGLFRDHGFSVDKNMPFSGSLVPSYYYRKNTKVSSIMIEIRRDLYMDEALGTKSSRYRQFADKLESVLSALISQMNTWS
jgi:N-formylglutamate amidohydrolase